MRSLLTLSLLAFTASVTSAAQLRPEYTEYDPFEDQLSVFTRRPKDCPPCFNCNLDVFKCHQFAECQKSNGRCVCPPGFGGNDCSRPLCGSLADGKDRAPARGERCKCKKGWGGMNCNVCKTDDVCNVFMPEGEGGVCYKGGLVVDKNYQMCDITNKKIVETLDPRKPHATFSCNAKEEDCTFQFWVEHKESFYCALDTCSAKQEAEEYGNATRLTTKYSCDNIKCRCIPGRMLCGEDGSVDIGDFLDQSIKGPATFTSIVTEGGSSEDGSEFHEPAMDKLILSIFGDEGIFLKCDAGECLYKTSVPGAKRPIKKINTPLIASVIAGCALFVAGVITIIWYLIRRGHSRWGPIHLSDDEDDHTAKLLTDHKPAALYFENVSYNLNGKQILSGISGAVNPGELLAIMGASGAGKTTFLDILARKNKRGITHGDFYLNGEKVIDEEFRSVIGFVDQEDTLLPTLTVHETILDSALLRLPRGMSKAAKEQKVEDVERQLGIYHIRHQIIGSEEGNGRGISGGEKRRVGIACELVTSPSILFLDEPTSGLDAYNAFNVVECLVSLVKDYNRTVVFTIHQPRSNIVALFDHLILLAKGRTVYSGPFSRCQSYFDDIGYACPPGFNIADYLVDLTMHAGTEHANIGDSSSMYNRDGVHTSSSSAVAVKSIPSISGGSLGPDTVGSPSGSVRPRFNRTTSIRQQQERRLFTRRKTPNSQTSEPARADDETSIPDTNEGDQQWLSLHRQHGAPPPQVLDDPDQLPAPDGDITGTDLDILVSSYKDSDVARSIHSDIAEAVADANNANGNSNSNGNANNAIAGKVKGYDKVGWRGQFVILSVRTWRNLYRNPMLLLTHYAIAILLAVFLGFLFFGLSDDISGFQNRLGLFFFILALFGFSTLTTLTVFSAERLLFVKERAKGYYSPVSYFAAKVIFDIVPLRLIPPIILGAIVYPMTGLHPAWPQFLKFIAFLVLFNFSAASICLFIGIVFKNGGMANLIGSLIMLTSLLFSGFFINRETIPPAVRWLQNLSIFHFGFEGLIVNETRYLSLIDHKYGLDIEIPGAAILSSFGFEVGHLPNDFLGLGIFCAVFVVLAYSAMHLLLVERR